MKDLSKDSLGKLVCFLENQEMYAMHVQIFENLDCSISLVEHKWSTSL